MISAQYLVDIADRLGAIDAVKSKLVKQPDPAAEKLVTVLVELSKIYQSMDEELTNYLALYFDDSDPKQLAREQGNLARLEGGEIRARMEEARGRCGKIWNIYRKYLSPWFAKVLNADEAEQLQALFRELSEVDSHMVDAITELSDWLSDEAAATNELVDTGELEDANEHVRSARREVRPVRKSIAEAMTELRKLEGAFIEISGAV